MSSLERKLSLCFACFGLATLAAVLWRTSGVALGASELGGVASLALWLGSIAVAVGAGIGLSCVLRRQLRRDVSRLRGAIHELATSDKQVNPEPLFFDELRQCAEDLTELASGLRREQARLSRDALHDPLTGLPNRRLFVETLDREVAFAKRTGWPLAMIMVDLDHFKRLNDTYGHKAGDCALQQASSRMASLVRESDVVARYGGEEFAIVVPGAPLEQAVQIARQLRDALRCDQFVFGGETLGVTASFGVAELYECRLTDSESLIRLADAALYQAKDRGRDTVVAAPAAEAAGTSAQSEDPVAEVDEPGADEDRDTALDRDTLALMGSTYSVLQVIPDRTRVARDIVQQVATVVRASSVRLYVVGQPDPLAAIGDDERIGQRASEHLRDWLDSLRAPDRFQVDRSAQPIAFQDTRSERGGLALWLPLMTGGQVEGAVEVDIPSSELLLSERQQTVLSALAAIGATALRCCESYERLGNRWNGLVAALSQAIHGLDQYKRDHCERVSELAVALAQRLGRHSSSELQFIRIAGLVYEVGNAVLPRTLLSRKGRLRSGEVKRQQEHCELGAELIGRVEETERLAVVVRHHHEHFDGQGYPDGLAGGDIPMESRILAVADTYVAMTSDRPHRAAWPHADAVEEIHGCAGRQFDPLIVDAFIDWAHQQDETALEEAAPASGVMDGA